MHWSPGNDSLIIFLFPAERHDVAVAGRDDDGDHCVDDDDYDDDVDDDDNDYDDDDDNGDGVDADDNDHDDDDGDDDDNDDDGDEYDDDYGSKLRMGISELYARADYSAPAAVKSALLGQDPAIKNQKNWESYSQCVIF